MKNGKRDRWETLAVVLIATYFLGRLLYFALNIAPDLPPDESTHVGLAEIYAESWLLPGNSPASFSLGLVSHVPYLYHLLMGKLLWLNLFGLETHHFLRLMNIVLAGLGLTVAYRMALDLMKDAVTRVLFLVMLTNTLMHTFLSAAVSYDNLVNLLAVSSLFFLLRHFRSSRPADLLAAGFCIAMGCLTKTSFLPLALFLGLIWIWERRSRLGADWRAYTASLRAGLTTRAWTVLVAVALLANLVLYGTNLARFGRLVPACENVLTLEQCLENRIFARNWIVGQYRTDRMTIQEAVRQTERIANPGDRAHTLRLLENERRYRVNRPEPLNRLEYAMLVWRQAMKPTIFGIQAHVSMVRPPNDLLGHQLVLLAALLFVARGIGTRPDDRRWVYLLAVVLFYFVFLLGFINYRIYVRTHAPMLAVQGRYLFPILVPALLLAAEFLLRPLRLRWRIVVAVLVGGVFIWGDLPYFLEHATDSWYGAREASTVSGTPSR